MNFHGGTQPVKKSLIAALSFSIVLHLLVLLIPQHNPAGGQASAQPIQARLREPAEKSVVASEPVTAQSPARKQAAKKSTVMAVPSSTNLSARRVPVPQWSAAEKAEMNKFLDELGGPGKAPPTLAQRSLTMAGNIARQQARESEAEMEIVERLPNSPPIDAFGLEMYMEALVKKLNRSAAHVKNDPRTQGLKVAAVQVRLNPNGSLNSFRVLNMADQQDEIAFIRRVVEQAIPFAAFPSDIQRSAKSLSVIICIMPARAGGGGFGFTRNPDGRAC